MKKQMGTVFGMWDTGRNLDTGKTFTAECYRDAFARVIKDGGKIGQGFLFADQFYMLEANDRYASGIGFRLMTIEEMRTYTKVYDHNPNANNWKGYN